MKTNLIGIRKILDLKWNDFTEKKVLKWSVRCVRMAWCLTVSPTFKYSILASDMEDTGRKMKERSASNELASNHPTRKGWGTSGC